MAYYELNKRKHPHLQIVPRPLNGPVSVVNSPFSLSLSLYIYIMKKPVIPLILWFPMLKGLYYVKMVVLSIHHSGCFT
jgi:hypothetical protein